MHTQIQINEYATTEGRLSWHDALDFCRQQGADLVSIHSLEEEATISQFVLEAGVYSYTYFWFGLNNLDLDVGYVWTDGELTFSLRSALA